MCNKICHGRIRPLLLGRSIGKVTNDCVATMTIIYEAKKINALWIKLMNLQA